MGNCWPHCHWCSTVIFFFTGKNSPFHVRDTGPVPLNNKLIINEYIKIVHAKNINYKQLVLILVQIKPDYALLHTLHSKK